MPLRVAMVSCAVYACSMAIHAQDYSQSQVTAMAHNYFAADVAVATMANNVTIDTLYLGDTPKMFLCQDGTNWVVLANEQSVSCIAYRLPRRRHVERKGTARVPALAAPQ